MNTTTSHKASKHREVILAHLQAGDTLTATQARIKYDCHNLAARISELRLKFGHKIESIKIGGGFVKYELDTNQPYEREFFEFLTGHNFLNKDTILKEYIKLRCDEKNTLNKAKFFTLPDYPNAFVSGAFAWPCTSKWLQISKAWCQRLERLTRNA